ncbi:MAG: hypothetical protein GY861_21520 [bacterium]|nr:hypothetical protein [bacterium]
MMSRKKSDQLPFNGWVDLEDIRYWCPVTLELVAAVEWDFINDGEGYEDKIDFICTSCGGLHSYDIDSK